MRRKTTTAIAASLLAFVLPATASAHHGARHDAAQEAGAHHHRRHHRRAHTVEFSPAATPAPSDLGTGSTPASNTAGTIASYEGGVLKITLADGTTVSGQVTEATRIQCGCPGHYSPGDGQYGDGRQGQYGYGRYGAPEGRYRYGSQSDYHGRLPGDWAQGASQGSSQGSCGVSALVPGAKVERATLSLGETGAEWMTVELVPANAETQQQS